MSRRVRFFYLWVICKVFLRYPGQIGGVPLKRSKSATTKDLHMLCLLINKSQVRFLVYLFGFP
ncbi:unnamed protein product [Larinioides sclopetarius]|uniref:Uncharacterized protein n=1 Tax=Larinioides sclopetarius TaxID=280406 RepID=A0AAV1ZPH9_9ARAC